MLPPCYCHNPQTLGTEVRYLFLKDIRIVALAIIGRSINIATRHRAFVPLLLPTVGVPGRDGL